MTIRFDALGCMVAAAVAFGCSGAAGDEASRDAQDSDPSEPPNCVEPSSAPRFLELTAVAVDGETGAGRPPNVDVWEVPYRVRVDLPEGGGPALVTPLGGQSASYSVQETDAGMVLTPVEDYGFAHGVVPSTDRPPDDSWKELTIEGTSFEAEVERRTSCGDCAWTNVLSVRGQVTPDRHSPSFSLWAPEFMPTTAGVDSALPWNVELRSDEGVAADQWQGRLSAAMAGDDLDASWTAGPLPSGTEGGGARALRAIFSDFAHFERPATMTITIAAGVEDLAGNGAGAETKALPIPGLGPARTAFDFSTAVPDAAIWGVVAVGTAGGACEGPSCLVIGTADPLDIAHGIAGRLTVGPEHRVVVEARAFEGEYSRVPVVTVAVPGGEVIRTPLYDVSSLVPSDHPELGGRATSWLTIEVEVPAVATEVGVAVGWPARSQDGPPFGSPAQTLVIRSLESR